MRAFLCLSLLGFSAAPAPAQEAPSARREKAWESGACLADMQEFCWQVDKGDAPAVSRCLNDHLAGISRGCLLALQDQPKSDPCYEDANKLCRGAVGPGATRNCLNRNSNRVSPACRKRLSHGEGGSAANPCEGDLKKLCAGEEADKGGCLRSRLDALTPACRDFLESSDEERDRPDERTFRGMKVGGPEFKAAWRTACEPDFKRFCGDETGDPGPCLRGRLDELFPDCREFFEIPEPGQDDPKRKIPARRKKPEPTFLKGWPSACAEELEDFCPAAKSVSKKRSCLWEYLKWLGEECRDKVRPVAKKKRRSKSPEDGDR